MPKSSKKRKEKVADFSKAKLKLGKGKAVPSNAIDTSFKARSIFLPSQSIVVDKDATEPTTKRQLTFGDLVSHLKHYNSGTRKDALLGFRELFESHWDLVAPSLTTLVNAFVKIFADEASRRWFLPTFVFFNTHQDANVRKQLISFLNWLLPRIPPEDLMPHAPLILLFITSAQTHIFPEIRIDAIRYLDIFLECVPDVVVSGWNEVNGGHGARVLEGYLGILNAGTKYGETEGPLRATSTASVVLTTASKLTVLKSLSKFLEIALRFDSRKDTREDTSHPLDAWFLETAFRSPEDFEMFERRLSIPKNSCNHMWQTHFNADAEWGGIYAPDYPLAEWVSEDFWTLGEVVSSIQTLSQTATGVSGNTAFISHLASTLHSTIIETYLDVAPSVFSPGSTATDTENQLALTVAQIIRTLYYPILRSKQNIEPLHFSNLETIVTYMSTYFPETGRSSQLDSTFEEMNLIFCELISLLVHTSASRDQKTTRKRTQRLGGPFERNKLSIQIGRVMTYITRRLYGEASSPSHIAVQINARAYLACLPTIWGFISNDCSKEMIRAVLDHALKTTSKSTCKGLTVEFVGRLALLGLDPRCTCNLGFNQDADIAQKFEAWVLHLPQVLWELGNTNLPLTQVGHSHTAAYCETPLLIVRRWLQTILCVLLRILQSNSKGAQGPPSEMIQSLQSRLIPYFFIDHPTRGAMVGPYKKLPPMETRPTWSESSLTSRPTRPTSSSRVRLLALDVVVSALVYSSGCKGAIGRSARSKGPFMQKEVSAPASSPTEGLIRAVGEAVSGEVEYDYWIHVSRFAQSFK
ncbi:hypothetical protein CVT24_005549 [Panaeolus cyanescens]|uniref:Pre-rRNA-processing protein n=1 Tax=Panaeolus cyanescens TaxID=181874 RepID=A0A409YBW5_9AGAR|nr:hypothetical protein CVT24_005549 [Panaeolus cyanescens]